MRSSGEPRRPVSCTVQYSLAGLLWCLAFWSTPSDLSSQMVRGVVRDGSTGLPVSGVLVRVDSIGTVTVSEPDGTFVLKRVPGGNHTLRFEGFRYRVATVELEVPMESPLEIELTPDPFELQGVEVVAESFQTRFSRVEADLDYRIARLPGHTRVADVEAIRPYDQLHAKDPWVFLAREMHLGWDVNIDLVRLRGRHRQPEVYFDDRRVWLYQVVEMPLPLVCRVELYEPPPAGVFAFFVDMVPLQLRAYSCSFMAEVARGERTFRSRINHGDLIAGPRGGRPRP